MRIIGLTGGIASGKSLVARILESLGAVVVDADILAREVVEPGKPALCAIVEYFGGDILLNDGSLDRKRLGQRVFADAGARGVLEGITHPAIAQLAAGRFEEERLKGTPVVFYMAPLLVEAGLVSSVDEVWVVAVDRETQLRRLMARDGMSREDAVGRVGAQMPLERKLACADLVIDNSGSPEETERKVMQAWEALRVRLGTEKD